jgi:hypothetical protein
MEGIASTRVDSRVERFDEVWSHDIEVANREISLQILDRL